LDVSSQTLELFSQDYTNEIYFARSYTSKTIGFDQTYVNPTYFDELYVATPILAPNVEEAFIGSIVDDPLASDSIITSPVDPTEPLVFEIDSIDGAGATFSLKFAPIVETAGYYDGVRGQLSESIVLQDSEFYQKFSYEVVTSYPIEQWIEPLKTHVHPSGTKPFGLINKIDQIDTRASIFSNDVLVLTPDDSVKTPEKVAKSFTKILGDCTVCTDDASVLSQEDFAFTKRIFESASNTDAGLVVLQNYTSEHYFSADYVSKKIGFEQDYAAETFFAEEYVGDDILADVATF